MSLSLTQAVTRVCRRLNKNPNDTVVTTRIKNHINDACQEKWMGYAWSFRYREYPLTLTARVTSGTMTATNGSGAITASGTPFDSSVHVGAWIRFIQDTTEAWYRIQTVGSTSTATIEPAYQGTTGASKTYELVKTDYLLPTELSDTADLKVMYGRASISPTSILTQDRFDHPPSGTGSPCMAAVFNQDQIKTTYTTGTLSGTLNTVTLTGVGTAWLANVKEGDSITIGSDTNTYTVYKVDSDTQITLYNSLTQTASGDTYTIYRQFGKVLRIWPAADQAYVVFIKGLRKYTSLVNDSDTNEFLDRFPTAVLEGAIWREAGSSPDPREDSLYIKSEQLWARAQGEDEQIFPKHNPRPIFNPRR